MRYQAIVLSALVLGCLAGCGPATADWTYTPFDNFDPSQVPMVPYNPYRAPSGATQATTPVITGTH